VWLFWWRYGDIQHAIVRGVPTVSITDGKGCCQMQHANARLRALCRDMCDSGQLGIAEHDDHGR